MTTLHLIRHGETDWNREGRFQGTRDIPLNDEGRRQARTLARAWDRSGDVFLTSPLARARETAEILAHHHGWPTVAPDARLVERHYGLAEGLTLAERRERFPDGAIPGGEEPNAIRDRARQFLDAVAAAHPGRRVVAVSHGGFINVLLALVSDGRVGTGKSLLGNASVSSVELRPGGWEVVEVGRTFTGPALGLRE